MSTHLVPFFGWEWIHKQCLNTEVEFIPPEELRDAKLHKAALLEEVFKREITEERLIPHVIFKGEWVCLPSYTRQGEVDSVLLFVPAPVWGAVPIDLQAFQTMIENGEAQIDRILCIPVQTCHRFRWKPATHSV